MLKHCLKTLGLICLLNHYVFGQFLSLEEIQSLRDNAITGNINNTFSKHSWQSVVADISHNKVVLLGEPNHGSREVFLFRNDWIKNLHEHGGYDVILFESGIGEVAAIDLSRNTLSPRAMTNGFFGGWRTSEVADLMSYVKANDLSIAGFDVQRTSGSFEPLLQQVGKDNNIDSLNTVSVEHRFGIAQRQLRKRDADLDDLRKSISELVADYVELQKKIQESTSDSLNTQEMFVVRTLENRVHFLEYMLQFKADNDWRKRWVTRDSMMAENVIWLAKNIYPGKKMIIVGHNFHIAKFNQKEAVMGEFLRSKIEEPLYHIGFFTRFGDYADNSGERKELSPPDQTQLDIKHVINQLGSNMSFLPIYKSTTPENNWLSEDVVINDTFIDLNGGNKLILKDHFDALVLISNSSMPVVK